MENVNIVLGTQKYPGTQAINLIPLLIQNAAFVRCFHLIPAHCVGSAFSNHFSLVDGKLIYCLFFNFTL